MYTANKKRCVFFLAIEGMIALLCLHYALITPAVFQNLLSTGYYLALCLFLLTLSGVIFVLLVVKKSPLHRVILLLGFGFGMLSCLINTPGSIPDEPAHASNIYLWSNRLLLFSENEAERNNPVYIQVQSYVRRADAENESSYMHTETTMDSYRQILQNTNWFYSKSDSQLVNATLIDHSVIPIVYLPAIIGFTVARLLSLGYYPMLMLARILMLAFYVFAASWSIKKIPVGKMALFITASLPMSLHLAASLSYDAVILALAMMTFSYIVYLAYGDIERLGVKEWLTILVLSALLAPCKVGVYLPIILLLLMVPHAKLGGKRQFFWFFMTVAAGAIASCVLMNLNALSIGVNNTQLQHYSGGTTYSVQWVINHPTGALRIMMDTLRKNFFSWLNCAVGSLLSWFSIKLSKWVIIGFECCLLLTTLKEEDVPPITPTPLHRLLLLLPVALCNFIFLLGMLVWWTPQGAPLIEGIQGRYFIPLIPLVLLAIPQISLKLHLMRGEIVIPRKGFSFFPAMACVVLSCASFLIQASVILSR